MPHEHNSCPERESSAERPAPLTAQGAIVEEQLRMIRRDRHLVGGVIMDDEWEVVPVPGSATLQTITQ
jgi:hypothetical protein